MFTSYDVLRLAHLPNPTEVHDVEITDDADGFRSINGPSEMVVFVDPDKPENIADHPVLGPIISRVKDAVFVTDPETGKTKLRSDVVTIPVDISDAEDKQAGPVGSVKLLHLTPRGKLDGTPQDDNYGIPRAWRAVAAKLKAALKNLKTAKNDNLGFLLDFKDADRPAKSDAIKALARGLGNVTYEEDLYKTKEEERCIDGEQPKKGAVSEIRDNVRAAINNVYLVHSSANLDCHLVQWREGDNISRLQTLTRFLAECPNNFLNSVIFVKVLQQIIDGAGDKFTMEIYGPEGSDTYGIARTSSLDAFNLHGLKAVHRGSKGDFGPFMVRVKYRNCGIGGGPIDMVAFKCVMQDNGGNNAKGPHAKNMQADMTAGASGAAILADFVDRKPDIDCDFVFGICSNNVDGDANQMNDIITLASGVTASIENTDAEGRIVLADVGAVGMRRIREEGREIGRVITVATLTGFACGIGGHRTLAISDNRKLLRDVEDHANALGEPMQGMQLDPVDFEQLRKKTLADTKNVVVLPVGILQGARGDRTGAAFIAEGMGLSEKKRKEDFLHLDIAPTLGLPQLAPDDVKEWPMPIGGFIETLRDVIAERPPKK